MRISKYSARPALSTLPSLTIPSPQHQIRSYPFPLQPAQEFSQMINQSTLHCITLHYITLHHTISIKSRLLPVLYIRLVLMLVPPFPSREQSSISRPSKLFIQVRFIHVMYLPNRAMTPSHPSDSHPHPYPRSVEERERYYGWVCAMHLRTY